MKIEISTESAGMQTYSVFDSDSIARCAREYFEKMDTVPTREWCTCPWKVHPDDHNVEEGKRRMRRVDDDDLCPLHSREGMLMYFFTWAVAHGRGSFTTGSDTV